MKGLDNILLEGRIEDARQYIANSIGTELLSDESEEILGYFIDGDPSGNHKYLMWMVKMHDIDSGFSPNMLIDLVERFHNNLDKIHPALILQDIDLGMDRNGRHVSRIATSPKNIDSYPDYKSLKGVVEAAEEAVTRKQKETEAKAGVDKLYEDERWLLVKPNTYEGSCYYGSSTKWCTASKDAPQHWGDYTKRGNLYYIIDKSHELGDYYKLALFKEWDGNEEWYDRADDALNQGTINAIRSMVPQNLITALDGAHKKYEEPKREPELLTLDEFREKLAEYIMTEKGLQTINTNSGTWKLDIDETDGVWVWYHRIDKEIVHVVQATPFWDGRNEIPFDFVNDEGMYGDWSITAGPESLETEHISQDAYLKRGPDINMYRNVEWGISVFLNHIYLPLVKQQLDKDFFKELIGHDYATWRANSYVSTFKFKYPPREGTMTQRFVDYLKQNPRKTSNQFYEDVLGYPRPRAHNNMFFSSIKDSGIVKMERQGRQFVYSLGPNYQAWVEGRLLRT